MQWFSHSPRREDQHDENITSEVYSFTNKTENIAKRDYKEQKLTENEKKGKYIQTNKTLQTLQICL